MITTPRFCKLILPIAVSTVLIACGSGSSGGGSAPSNNVGGTASKGIIIGGTVNAYAIAADGTVDRTTPLATPAVTAEDGTYSLTLNSSYVSGTAIFIEISAEDGATMRCDVTQCGTVDGTPILFGDTYPLASTFTMAATLPKADSSTVTVNVTPLTDIASKLTLQKVVSGARASDAALASNAQIANRLGITGGLINQAIVDITNANAVNGATKDALDYNLKAAAAIAAILKDDSSLSLEDAVASLSNQFANGGIADKETTESTAITIEELLEEALAILDAVKAVEGVDSDDQELTGASTSITAAEADAEQNGDTTASQGDIPDDIGSEGLIAAKAFVKQVRDLGSAGVITENQAAFADQVDLAAQVLADDGDIVAEAMGLALNAIANAVGEFEDAEGTKPTSSTTDGITVAISVSGDTETYKIDQNLSVSETDVALALSAVNGSVIDEDSDETENDDGSVTYVAEGTATIDLSITGSAESSAAKLTIDEGSSISASFAYSEQSDETEFFSEYNEEWNDATTVEDASASLSVTLAQLGGDNPVSFTGAMNIALDLLDYTDMGEYSSEFGENGYSESEKYTETTIVDGFEITLSGEFSDASGNAISATLAANLTNFDETCTSDLSYSNLNGYSYSYTCDDETAQDYAMGNLSIIFDVDLAGVSDDINVNFSAGRTGLNTGEGSIKLSYGGKQLNLVYEGGNSVSLSNHNNVTLVLTETESGDEISVSGAINVGDDKFADVNDDSGAIIIRYSDGSFESIM
jgi:trimeric autotransporter adhesin